MNATVSDLPDAMSVAGADTPPIDARPKLPASDSSLWDRAILDRDRIGERLDQVLRGKGVLAWIRKSKPGEYPSYVLVDNWVPKTQLSERETTDRSSLKIIMKVSPYLENPIIYSAELVRQGKTLSAEYWALSDVELEDMAQFMIEGGRKPAFFRPRNSRVRRFLGAFFPPLIWSIPKNRVIAELRPNTLTAASALGVLGLIVGATSTVGGILAADIGAPPEGYVLGTLVGVLLLAAAYWISSRRPTYLSVPVQSMRTPRNEYLMDSWHVSVPNAGKDFDRFRARIVEAVSQLDPSIVVNVEVHQQLTPRGFEERERIVLSKEQANVHVHVYSFGRDAFVGWDGYMNWARWAETDPVHSRIEKGVKIDFKSLEAGLHVPTEFDLMELNALSELVHRAMVDEIKRYLAEREITADLDFSIIRGDRDKALTAGKKEQPAQRSRFRKAEPA